VSEFKAAVEFLVEGLKEAVSGVPVYIQVDPGSVLPDRVPVFLSLVFFERPNTEAEEEDAVGFRSRLWTWYVYLVMASDLRDRVSVLDQVGDAEEAIRGELQGEEVDAFSDGIRLTSLQFAGFTPGGQIYRLVLSYNRTEG
jgi:hypothetical protein